MRILGGIAFVAEISASSASYDLHDKRNAYQLKSRRMRAGLCGLLRSPDKTQTAAVRGSSERTSCAYGSNEPQGSGRPVLCPGGLSILVGHQ